MQTNNPQPALRQASTSLNNATRGKNPGSDSLGKEDFLNLLMAQVTHQDPLNPMDSQGMMDQLTSMGSLEQLVNLNKELGTLNATQRDIAQSNIYTFLDKDVRIQGGQAQVTAGKPSELGFQLPREASSVQVFITDADGKAVRSLDLGQTAKGNHNTAWDGRDSGGEQVADGTYRYTVAAKAPDEQSIPVDLFMQGKVSGVKFVDGRPQLILNGATVDPRDIIEISTASQRLFSNREPRPLQGEMKPRPPAETIERKPDED